MNAPVLVALEQRAGASDQDRAAWLADRRTGVTATDLAKLKLKRITIEKLVALKLGREVDSFSGNVYTEWGNLREPIIAGIIEHRYGSIRPESRVFRAADEPRFLASPDGVGMYGFDEQLVVSEIKTAEKDIAPWTDAYADKGYEFQMQWVMRVTGAERCLYAWERREVGADGEFTSGELKFEWVERNERIIADLEKIGRRFLAALDKAAAEPWDGPPPIDEVLDTHAVNYLRGLDLERQARALKAPAWAALLEAKRSQVSALARITYKEPEPVEVEEVDYAAARAADEDLFGALSEAQRQWDEHCEKFRTTRTVTGKPTLRVTAVRPPRAEEQEA